MAGRCAGLSLLAAAALLLLLQLPSADAAVTPASRLYREFARRNNKTIEAWDAPLFGEFLERAGLSAAAAAAIRAEDVRGDEVLQLDPVADTGFAADDAALYYIVVSALRDEFDDVALEQRSLWEVQLFYPREFLALFVAGSASPLAAVGLIHMRQTAFDQVRACNRAPARAGRAMEGGADWPAAR
jgi:hypothetical protein